MTNPSIFLGRLWESAISHRFHPLRVLSPLRLDAKKNKGTQKVDQPGVSSGANKVLSFIDILKEMSNRQSVLIEELRKKKISTNLLHHLQNELLKEWKNQSTSPVPISPEEEIINLTLVTTSKLDLYDDTFEEKDLQFMLNIGWKLAQHNLGLPHKLETDDQYPAIKAELVSKVASISNPKISDAMTAYLSFSFGMNSGYLFYSYLKANAKMKIPLSHKLSPLKIKSIRDTGLKLLLRYIQELKEIDSQGMLPDQTMAPKSSHSTF